MIITWIYLLVRVRTLRPDSIAKWPDSVAKWRQSPKVTLSPNHPFLYYLSGTEILSQIKYIVIILINIISANNGGNGGTQSSMSGFLMYRKFFLLDSKTLLIQYRVRNNQSIKVGFQNIFRPALNILLKKDTLPIAASLIQYRVRNNRSNGVSSSRHF